MSCDCCEDAPYIEIRATRVKDYDRLYQGKREVDWYDPETRLALVRDFGWSCFEPSWECDGCNCKEYCQWHEKEV